MRFDPPSNINAKRTLREWISHVFGSIFPLDVLLQILLVILGLGFLGYVLTSWVQHLISQGSYLFSGLIACTGLVLSGLAIARIPIALIVVFGGAAVCAVSFLSGFAEVLLP